jgi:serine phosphatase RsbU (regulator of sigma subunit)
MQASRSAVEQSDRLLGLARMRFDQQEVARASALPQLVEGPQVDAAGVVADLVVAGRYLPAGPGPEPIAGDFYDVLRVGPDRLALVVGDVTDHGASALQRMSALRAATRATALEQLGPRDTLAVLDAFLDDRPDEGLATVWYGEYVPSTGELVYASAGHPPPVLTCHGDPTRLLQIADAPPLGTGVAHALAREHRLTLPDGAVLIAYSDGLVERPDADLGVQLALLRETVTVHCDPAHSRTAQQMADAILHALVPEPSSAQDDVCLMVVRRQREPDQPGTA